MALRVSVVVEGNAQGGRTALAQTAAGLDTVAAKGHAAAASTTALSSASRSTEAALQGEAAAARANTAALEANNAAARRATAQRANLVFQLNDIFVSLASGMHPGMVAIQQGSQISQIYGPGGLGKALRETGNMAAGLVTKFWPIAAAAGVAAVAIGGMTAEIRAQTGVNVSWGDTTLAMFQVIGRYIYDELKPAIDVIGGWFSAAWEQVKATTAAAFNAVARSLVSNLEVTKFVLGTALPAWFRIGAEAAATAFLKPIQWMVDQTIGGINTIIAAMNQMGAKIQPIDPFQITGFDFGGTQAAADLVAGQLALRRRQGQIATTDYAGNFFDDVSDQAVDNYNDRQKKKKTKGVKVSDYQREIAAIRERTGQLQVETNVVGLSTFAAEKMRKQFELESAARKDATGLTAARIAEIDRESSAYARAAASLEQTREVYDALKGTFNGFFADLKSELVNGVSLWDAFATAGANALDKLADRAFSMAADGIFDMLFSAFSSGVTGGLGGGLFGGAGLSRVGSFSIGGMPSYASGTDFHPGGWARINEEGPEIVKLPRGSQVIPAGRSAAALSGGQVVYAPTYNGLGLTFADLRRLQAEDQARFAAELPALLDDHRRRGRFG